MGVFAVASLIDAVRVPRLADEVFFVILLAIALYDLYCSVVLEQPVLKPWALSGLLAFMATYFSLATAFFGSPHLVGAAFFSALAVVFAAVAFAGSRKASRR